MTVIYNGNVFYECTIRVGVALAKNSLVSVVFCD